MLTRLVPGHSVWGSALAQLVLRDQQKQVSLLLVTSGHLGLRIVARVAAEGAGARDLRGC